METTPAGPSVTMVGVGSPQYPAKIDKIMPSGVVGAGTLDLMANAAFLAAFPVTRQDFLHTTNPLPQSDWATGLYVFPDIDPTAHMGLGIVGVGTAGGDPNNLTATVRVWQGRSLNVRNPRVEGQWWSENVGQHAFELLATIGNLRVPDLTLGAGMGGQSGLFPKNPAVVNIAKWADTMALVGTDFTIPPGVRFTGHAADCLCLATWDLMSSRWLVVAIGETAATPVPFAFPVLVPF